MPQQQDTDRSRNIEESEECDDTLRELAGIACHPDSTINADTWVKAAEFVPGQESEECDDTLRELAGIACHPDSTICADTWVKAAEFVPGQLWQSMGK